MHEPEKKNSERPSRYLKDQLGPEDRVNIAPVHIEVDHTWNISPGKAMKTFDIPWQLRKPATIEFNKMLKSRGNYREHGDDGMVLTILPNAEAQL